MEGGFTMLQGNKLINGKGAVAAGLGIIEKASHLREGVDGLKERVEEKFEGAVSEAKRMAKKGRYAAEDLIDDAEYKIKKAPFRSVGVMFAAGLGLGLVAGVLAARMSHACSGETRS
jgi:ElaB/YqjD/DUF883 family membrane-anchored ribosome-binding protein